MGRGRPEFKPTAAQRERVQTLISEMSEEDICRVIGISPPTLRKHFAEELGTGRAIVRAEALEALRKQAKKGNIAAIRTILQRTALTPEREPKPKIVAKKEAAQAVSETAAEGTGWSDLVH